MNLKITRSLLFILALCVFQNAFAGLYIDPDSPYFNVWPDSRIPYVIDPNWPEEHMENIAGIHAAANYLSTTTNLCVEPANENDTKYVIVQYNTDTPGLCYANSVGYYSFYSSFTISCSGLIIGVVCHEFLHIAGMHHEHKRPDRDEFVFVSPSNINNSQYSIVSDEHYNWTDTYDFHSIMHYGNVLSINPLYVNTGTKRYLSSLDVESVNSLYPNSCNGTCQPIPGSLDNYFWTSPQLLDGWGDPMIPFECNVTGPLEFNGDINGGMVFANSDAKILLSPGFQCRGNEVHACFQIEDCENETAGKKEENIKYGGDESAVHFRIYPNPFKETTRVQIELLEEEFLSVEIIDLNGRVVSIPLSGQLFEKGKHEIKLEVGDLNEGVYLCKIQGEDWIKVEKMIKD